jgi:hypothetical protein
MHRDTEITEFFIKGLFLFISIDNLKFNAWILKFVMGPFFICEGTHHMVTNPLLLLLDCGSTTSQRNEDN